MAWEVSTGSSEDRGMDSFAGVGHQDRLPLCEDGFEKWKEEQEEVESKGKKDGEEYRGQCCPEVKSL